MESEENVVTLEDVCKFYAEGFKETAEQPLFGFYNEDVEGALRKPELDFLNPISKKGYAQIIKKGVSQEKVVAAKHIFAQFHPEFAVPLYLFDPLIRENGLYVKLEENGMLSVAELEQ